jgi:hypothetical protein
VVIRFADTADDITNIGVGLAYTRTTYTGYKVYTFTSGTGSISW